MSSDSTVTTNARIVLVPSAPSILLLWKNATYHFVLQLSGGKAMRLSPENEIGPTRTTGASRNRNIRVARIFSVGEIGRSSMVSLLSRSPAAIGNKCRAPRRTR
jgi:hypothetical protein